MRTLRDGRSESGPAPLLLLCDELAVVGGPALMRQASDNTACCRTYINNTPWHAFGMLCPEWLVCRLKRHQEQLEA